MTQAEDKEKAEKLAAAKKRFEQLKKQKGKKAPAKKKDDKTEAEAEPTTSDDIPNGNAEAEKDAHGIADAPAEEPTEVEEAADPAEEQKSAHNRKPSASLESMMRSSSFRQQSTAAQSPGGVRSPTLEGPGAEVQDIYRKQAQRIEELEKENKRLQSESSESDSRWRKAEDDLEEMRETNGDVADLKSKADKATTQRDEIEKLQTEITSLSRQISQLQSSATKRRQSSMSVSLPSSATPASSDDLHAQLASKSSTIESLELSLSNLQADLSSAQTTSNTQAVQIETLQSSLLKAESDAKSAAQELADLKSNLAAASEAAKKEGSGRGEAETRIAQLQAELSAARRAADDGAKRAETLGKKVETLTTLHRESDARSQTRMREAERTEREAKELRVRVTGLGNENARLKEEVERRRKTLVEGDGDGVEELEDEERVKMQARIRGLEDEVFELRRGVWRDRRRELQPGLEEQGPYSDSPGGGGGGAGFDDVDLSPMGPTRRASVAPLPGGKGSSFQDVINSGISAFTGKDRQSSGSRPGMQGNRKQSLGLLSEDGDVEFDEDAFRLAQEDAAKQRLERVKEVKRGLGQWKDYRIDIVELRSGLGGVFEI